MTLVKYRKPNVSVFPDLFDDFINDFWAKPSLKHFSQTPAANIKENDNNIEIELAIPGLKKEDLKLEINENLLRIYAEKEEKQEENNEGYFRKEFSYSSFERSFRMPENINQDAISANYSDGVLKVLLPKQANKETKKLIDIN